MIHYEGDQRTLYEDCQRFVDELAVEDKVRKNRHRALKRQRSSSHLVRLLATGVCLPVCLYACLSLALCLPLCLPLSLSPFLPLSLSFSLFLALSGSLQGSNRCVEMLFLLTIFPSLVGGAGCRDAGITI